MKGENTVRTEKPKERQNILYVLIYFIVMIQNGHIDIKKSAFQVVFFLSLIFFSAFSDH